MTADIPTPEGFELPPHLQLYKVAEQRFKQLVSDLESNTEFASVTENQDIRSRYEKALDKGGLFVVLNSTSDSEPASFRGSPIRPRSMTPADDYPAAYIVGFEGNKGILPREPESGMAYVVVSGEFRPFVATQQDIDQSRVGEYLEKARAEDELIDYLSDEDAHAVSELLQQAEINASLTMAVNELDDWEAPVLD